MASKKTPKLFEVGCFTCGATGHYGADSITANNPFCPACKGRGKLMLEESAFHSCRDCKGRGHVENVPCFPCAHTGLVENSKNLPEIDEIDPAAFEKVTNKLQLAEAKISELSRTVAEHESTITEFVKENKALEKELKALKKKAEKAAETEKAADPAAPPAS